MTTFKNNGKLKLLIIVGTRPEIIRLAAVINKCRKYFDCILAHTGQNYDYNLNCAQTTLMCLGSFFHIEISKQVFDAAVGLDGAGRFGAQCGLVEGAIMFLGIYLSQKNFSADEIEKTCSQFASEFKAKFGSLECSKLRPQGFNKNDPPHLCESLTVNAIIFDYSFLKNL